MSLPLVSAPVSGNPHLSTSADTRLRGRGLIIARVGWGAAAALALGLFLISLPTYLEHLQTVCAQSPCPYQQLTLDNAHALGALGISVGGYAALTLTLTLGVALVWVATGGILFWRRSDDWMALLVAVLLVFQGASAGTGDLFTTSQVGWEAPANLLSTLVGPVIFLVFFLFPSGRFVPRWTRWFALVFLLTSLPHQFFANWYTHLPVWASLPDNLAFVGAVLSVPFAQIYRYRRVSPPIQRQQTKWIVFCFTGLVVVLLGGNFPVLLSPALNGSLYGLANTYVEYLVSLLIPLAFAVAILRYRLWDIDAIINKVLVYGLLTGLLGLCYAGLIIALTSLTGAITGTANQPIVAVASTLAIAALFLPLRHRIQALIDRRFYRRKYDAEKTLAAFSAVLRNEIDLERIQERLLAVARETMQPAHASLWLRQPERNVREQAARLDLPDQIPPSQTRAESVCKPEEQRVENP